MFHGIQKGYPIVLNYCNYIIFLNIHFIWFNFNYKLQFKCLTEIGRSYNGKYNFDKRDYVNLLINGQVIGLGRVESTDTTTHYGGERVNVGYVMVLIIDVIEPHLIVEYIDEGDLHPWKIIDLRHNKGKSKS